MLTEHSWELKPIDKKLVLENNELHIWRTNISKKEHDLDYYKTLLTREEQAHANNFYFVEDRNRYIVARAILRRLIASYDNVIDPQSILFEYTEYGKPYLSAKNNFQQIKFNIAHSNAAIVYAFTKNIDVGIDIEFINKNFSMDDVVKYCCSEQEQHYFQKLLNNQKYYYFYKLWVIKESLVKAMGLGLSYDLGQIHINFGKNKLIDPIDVINNDKIHWTVSMFLSYNGYFSAFTTKIQVEKVFFFTFGD